MRCVLAGECDGEPAMTEVTCKICEKSIDRDQDSTTLVCHAGGQTIQHTSNVHDKCWECFKKQFLRSRSGKGTAHIFFCPVAGCHNALDSRANAGALGTTCVQVQSTLAAADEAPVSATPTDTGGSPSSGSVAETSQRRRRKLEEETAELDDDASRCREYRQDGMRCGRTIFDHELGVCKLHVEAAKRKIRCASSAAERRWRTARDDHEWVPRNGCCMRAWCASGAHPRPLSDATSDVLAG